MKYSHLRSAGSLVAVILAVGYAAGQTPVGTAFTYQGHLKEGGLPVTEPAASLRFRLFDALTDGSQIGSDCIPVGGVNVLNGLFTTQVDFGAAPFAGDARWVEIAVYELGTGYVTLSPRQPLTAIPYALYALNGGSELWQSAGSDIYYTAGDVGIGIVNPTAHFEVQDGRAQSIFANNTAHSGAAYALYGKCISTSGRGVYGEATAASGATYGIEGYAVSPAGFAIYGFNEADSGDGCAIRGDNSSPDGIAVFGYAGSDAGTGTTIGVKGQIDNAAGAAMYGQATATTGTANGVYAETASTQGSGVFGQNTSRTGDNEGVFGVSWSPDGEGVFGANNSTTGDAIGVLGRTNSTAGYGVYGEASPTTGTTYGVYGKVSSSAGYAGYFSGGRNYFEGPVGIGVLPATDPKLNVSTSNVTGVRGASSATDGRGVFGEATFDNGDGVYGEASGLAGIGVLGASTHTTPTIYGWGGYFTAASDAGTGVYGEATAASGATYGGHFSSNSATGYGLFAENTASGTSALAIYGYNGYSDGDGVGVKGVGGYRGVEGRVETSGTSSHYGVYGYVSGGSGSAFGVRGYAGGTGTTYGIYGAASGGTTNYAGYFSGNVSVTGTLSKGGGSFKIDHPLDPENKYLYHSFVESPDMMNIYNGNATLDASGEAVVTMPEWFEALNRDFRYQLTCIGGFAPAYVAEEIANNQFKIAGGKAGLKVSWQVTGVRHDAFAEANRIPVEVDKPADERGTYLHPTAFGQPETLQLDRTRDAAELEATAAVASETTGN
jgi:hypothetical protein